MRGPASKTLNPHAGSFVPTAAGSTTSNPTTTSASTSAWQVAAADGSTQPSYTSMPQLSGAPTTSAPSLTSMRSAAHVPQQQGGVPAEARSHIHHMLMQARLAVVERCGQSSTPFPNAHLYFEREMYSLFKHAAIEGTIALTSHRTPPFWQYFSCEQIATVARVIAEAESLAPHHSNSHSAGPFSGSATDSRGDTFTDEELDILKGIYFRNAHSVFPAPLRKQLIAATAALLSGGEEGGVTQTMINEVEDILVDIFWFTYRTALLPSIEDCGVQAMSAAVQFLTQLRSYLLQRNVCRVVLGLVLPLMTLSRYFVVLQRGALQQQADPSSVASLRILYSQQFVQFMSQFFTASPDDAIEVIQGRFPTDFVRDMLPMYFVTTTEVQSQLHAALERTLEALPPVRGFGTRRVVVKSTSTFLEAALANNSATTAQDDPHQRVTPTRSAQQQSYATPGNAPTMTTTATSVFHSSTSGESLIPLVSTATGDSTAMTSQQHMATTGDDEDDEALLDDNLYHKDSAFLEHVLAASSWCGSDDIVRFAALTLANTEIIPLSRLSQLLSGLREAYCGASGGSHEALFDILAQCRPAAAAAEHGGRNDSNITPPGIQEVLECIINVIEPGKTAHVQALEEATQIIDKRLEDQVATASMVAAAHHAPPSRLLGGSFDDANLSTGFPMATSPGIVGSGGGFLAFNNSVTSLQSPQRGFSLDDDTATLWQTEEDVRSIDETPARVAAGSSATNNFQVSGSIW